MISNLVMILIAVFVGLNITVEVNGAVSYPTFNSLPKPIFSDFSGYSLVHKFEELWYDSPNEQYEYYKGTAVYLFDKKLSAPIVSG